MKRIVKDSDGLTFRQYMMIAGVGLVIFTVSMFAALTLGDYFADWIYPVY